MLRLQRETARKTIHFERGRIRFASTNRPDERLDEFAVRNHLATWWQVQEAAREITPTRRLGGVLVDLGILSPEERARLVRDQLREIVIEALGWEDGSFDFDPSATATSEAVTLDWSVADAFLEEARHCDDEGGLWGVIGGPDARIVPSTFAVAPPDGLTAAETRIVTAIDGHKTVEEIARAAAAPLAVALRVIVAIVRLGGCAVHLERRVGRDRSPEPSVPEAPGRERAAADRPVRTPAEGPWVLPKELRAERAAVLDLADRLDRMDHYQVLDIAPDATQTDIHEAFRDRVSKLDPDRARAGALAGLRGELERLHRAVHVAHATLSDSVERAAYDARRARERRAAQARTAALDESCLAFLERATRLIREGRFPDAIPPLREAIRLRPDMAVAHYRLGQCLATIPGETREARDHLERASALEPRNPRYREALRALEPARRSHRRAGLGRRLTRWLQLPLDDE